MNHIEFETLLKYFENLLPIVRGQEISEHLRNCRTCAAQSQKLENFLSYAQKSEYESVSQSVTASLLNIYRPKKLEAKKESFVKKLAATLAFDDWQIALNERFILSDTRQLLYKADKFDIDLRLNFVGEKCQVSGQVFPDCQNATAEIFSKEFKERILLNQDCEFVFPPIKNGVYDLRINSEDTIIEIQDISLLI